jgi:voltage-gated sodium channel
MPYFGGDISISMLTLFRVSTFEDWTDVMYETMNA